MSARKPNSCASDNAIKLVIIAIRLALIVYYCAYSPNGRVLVTGGLNQNRDVLGSAEMFTP